MEKLKHLVAASKEELKKLAAKVECRFRGHRRGKLLRAENNGRTKIFGCPRCHRETRYSVKAAA